MSRSGRLAAAGVIIACLAFLLAHVMRHGRGQAPARQAARAEVDADASVGSAPAPDAQDALPPEPEVPAPTPTAEEPASTRERADRATQSQSIPQPRPTQSTETVTTSQETDADSGAPQELGPRIQFDDDTFDFGTLYQREETSHEFMFRNVGDAVLEIVAVKSTCGCAAAVASSDALPPGEQGVISCTVNAGRLRGDLTKHVYVDSSDPTQPRVTLTITGKIEQEVEVNPPGVYIGRMALGDVIQRTVLIRSVDLKSFEILRIVTDHPALHVGEPARLAGEFSRYELTIGFGPTQEPERVNAKVTVYTDLERSPEIPIPVYGRVVQREKTDDAAAHENLGQ